MKQEQPVVEPKDYLFGTWIKETEIINTEKGEITILELLTDFRSHLVQNLDHNKEAYHQKQCAIHDVSKSLKDNRCEQGQDHECKCNDVCGIDKSKI